VLSRVLAFEIQTTLDEYKRANPDFPVRAPFFFTLPRPKGKKNCGG
jgi:hypothetical protein